MIDIVFSLGTTTIGGQYSALCLEENGALSVQGRMDFYQIDMFEHIAGIARATERFRPDLGENFGELPLSTRYKISDEWTSVGSDKSVYTI